MGTRDRDSLQRFVFERARVRGELVRLDATWQEVLRRRDYPLVLRPVLGELMAACALLAATIKFPGGALVLQIQGGEPVRLLVIGCQSDLTLRAAAHWEGDLGAFGDAATLRGLAAGGLCAITIDPGPGRQAYQGMVPLEGGSTAEVLERYMARSEQLETRFRLAADDGRAAGLLLQKLPTEGGHPGIGDEEALWSAAADVLDAFSTEELLSLAGQDILRRVFNGEHLRGFEDMDVRFGCRCSRKRVAAVIRMIGAEEARSILAEHGAIQVTCEFCHERYVFSPRQTEEALQGAA